MSVDPVNWFRFRFRSALILFIAAITCHHRRVGLHVSSISEELGFRLVPRTRDVGFRLVPRTSGVRV